MKRSELEAIPAVLQAVAALRPSTILEVGIGAGVYALLLREYVRCDSGLPLQVDGVVIDTPVERNSHPDAYDRVQHREIHELTNGLEQHDVVLALGLVERFDKEEGMQLLAELARLAGTALILTTSLDPEEEPADSQMSSTSERRSRWSEVDLVAYDAIVNVVEVGLGGTLVATLARPEPEGELGHPETTRRKPTTDVELLRVGYLLPHTRVTGGLLMLLEQIRYLETKGHVVRAIRIAAGGPVVPDWCAIRPSEEELLAPGAPLERAFDGCDVVAAGWVDDVLRGRSLDVPMLYVEQGHEWLFGDIRGLPAPRVLAHLREVYTCDHVSLGAVSGFLADAMEARYRRRVAVVPAWLPQDRIQRRRPSQGSESVVLLVGNPALRFKCHGLALRALSMCWHHGARFRVIWVANQGVTASVPFPMEIIVSPPQDEIAKYYMAARVFVSASAFEAFGLPPLEAMASGAAVVATDCGGIRQYAEHGVNCLLCQPYDVHDLARAILTLLTDDVLLEHLVDGGLRTASQYTADVMGPVLEQALVAAARRAFV